LILVDLLYFTHITILRPSSISIMESAADKQKRLIQQEIAKLSGKLAAPPYWTRGQKLINQEQSLDTDKADHHAHHPTQQQDPTHMHQEVLPEEEEGVGEEVDTHWI
jgi:DNA topoisomerase IA